MKKVILLLLGASCIPYNSASLVRHTNTLSEYKLMDYVMDPFRREDLKAFSDPPPNYIPSDDPDDVYFFLYNNPNAPDQFYKIDYNDCSALKALPWIKNAPIKVLIHGFTQSQNSSMPAMVKNAYLEQMREVESDAVNVVVVDWGKLAGSLKSTVLPIYTRAVRNVERTGIRVGEFLANLWKCTVVSTMNDIHVVGFSLGAHVAGWAGKTAAELVSPIGRVTGLDPAGPLFYLNITNFTGRDLKNTDGQFVDVIHTSWGSYGIARKIGNVDFYPNFGLPPLQTQPHCARILNTARPLQVCSHNMAPVFFSMSILQDLYACKCNSILTFEYCRRHCEPSTFGEYWETTNTGDYYLSIPSRLLQEPESGEIDGVNEIRNLENTVTRSDRLQLGVELTPKNIEQVACIQQLRNTPGYLFWSGNVTINEPISILVSNAMTNQFLDKITHVNLRNNARFYRVDVLVRDLLPDKV